MPIFRCAECGNTIESDAPPQKCDVCGAQFSYDEVADEKQTDTVDEEENFEDPEEFQDDDENMDEEELF